MGYDLKTETIQL